VEFAPVSNPALVPAVTAAALKLPAETKRPAIDMLCDYLRERHLLLMLDNCEHLVEACAQMAETLLKVSLNLHILVTSREALRIPGELTYLVPSLKLPDLQQLPPIDSLTKCEAVKLFVERAAAVFPDFQVTNNTAPAVTQICHRLDGIPLAIELAAAKVNVLSLEQISKRLDDCFRLLTGGSRTALERHQTLRATIEWSYNLLSPPQQTLFRRLSVFVNGWSFEAAEKVCSDESEGDVIQNEYILDLLTQLMNKSLVIVEIGKSESRCRMLETVRQYASDRLVEAGEKETTCDRHLEYYLYLAETAEPHLRKTEQIEWLDRLETEHDNLRSALEWTLEKPAAEFSLRLAGALSPFWDTRDLWKEGIGWLHSSLEKSIDKKSEKEKAARAKALYRISELSEQLDDLNHMKESAEAAYRLCKEIGDKWGAAYSRYLIAYHMSRVGIEIERFKPLVEQSMSDFQDLDDVWGLSAVYISYVWILFCEGKQKIFHKSGRKQIALARKSGDRKLIAKGLEEYSGFLIELGEWKQAEKYFKEAELLSAEIGCLNLVTLIRSLSAEILFALSEYGKARDLLMECREFFRLAGAKFSHSRCLFLLALISNIEGNLQQAKSYLQAGLDIRIEINHTYSIPMYITLFSYLNFKQGNFDLAKEKLFEGIVSVRNIPESRVDYVSLAISIGCSLFVENSPQAVVLILSSTETMLQRQNMPRDSILDKPFYERNLDIVRAKMSEEEFNVNWENGKKMSLEDVIEFALKIANEM
jgi:predicted ATPase